MKKILLGVTGSIAAYKAAELVRLLKKQHYDVRVVMTQSAHHFINPMTFQALSGYAVRSDLFDPQAEAAMGHIELARWADMILIAPASANVIAKLAHGYADDLLSTLCLAASAPVLMVPAMNQNMWHQAVTQENVALLKARGVSFIGPEHGEQACGDDGFGRMSEPETIVASLQQRMQTSHLLAGMHVVITAGPTQEKIDPVRYLSNYSSGKMGYALATAAHNYGAKVTLISGPINDVAIPVSVECIHVDSAMQMYQAVMAKVKQSHVFIAAAAVADYRCAQIEEHKIKKGQEEELILHMIKNPDILAEVAALPDAPFCVGFAAETQRVEEYAKQKMQRKNIPMIIANQVGIPNQGFGADKNQVIVFYGKQRMEFPYLAKTELARQLMELIGEKYHEYSMQNA